VDIIRERPSQRLHHRVTAPLRVTLDGKGFDVVDWSLGGFRLTGWEAPAGEDKTVFCTLPFQGFDITFEAKATAVRTCERTKETAFRFLDLGEREAGLMRHFVEDLVRGKMTDVEDTILRIDTPVTPVPTKPDPNPVHQVPVRRWPIKQIVMTVFYLLLGIAVFGYVAVFLFASLFRLEISTAVVTAERTQINAPAAGELLRLPFPVGAAVSQGATIAAFADEQLEAQIQKAELALMQAKVELTEHKSYLSAEEDRERGYQLVAENKLRKAEAELGKLQLAVETSADRVARYEDLFSQGYLKKDILDNARLEQATATATLEQHALTLSELQALSDMKGATVLFGGSGFAGVKSERIAEVARWQEEVDFRSRLLAQLQAEKAETVLQAPFDGEIIGISASPGATLKRGEPVLVLEAANDRSVTAFLTQDEIATIRQGSQAKIFIPSENRWIGATVDLVNRTDGFVDEITETHRFRAQDARSAKVVLSAAAVSLPPAGTPVAVYFERHRGNVVFRTLSGLWRDAE